MLVSMVYSEISLLTTGKFQSRSHWFLLSAVPHKAGASCLNHEVGRVVKH